MTDHSAGHISFIDRALSANVNFYAIRQAAMSAAVYGASERLLHDAYRPGFVIAGFNHCGRFDIIPSDIQTADDLPDKPFSSQDQIISVPVDTSAQEHHLGVEGIVKELRQSGEGKTVLSRVKSLPCNRAISAIFQDLAEAYPNATVFCFRTEKHGLWIGATPELLMESNGETISTMALAGTRKCGSPEPWDSKNCEEQQIVTDFIRCVFESKGLNPEVSRPETFKAGPVEHIRTLISAKSDSLSADEKLRLALSLSPTPALSGFPREKSLAMISHYESHDRACYGGFFGLLRANGDMALYVNLRSATINRRIATLFAGGGITRFSEPETEWQETEMKLSTLASFF